MVSMVLIVFSFLFQIDVFLCMRNKSDILLDPQRIFHLDESGFQMNPQTDIVLVKRRKKQVYSASTKSSVAVLYGANAYGDILPPMIVYNYKRIPIAVQSKVPRSIAIGISESGWTCAATFYDYIVNHFVPWINEVKIQLPVIVFINDVHYSQLSFNLCRYCLRTGIILFPLPANATHIMQPMDVGIFDSIKTKWKAERDQWSSENCDATFSKSDFAPLLKKTIDHFQGKQSLFADAFRVCGNLKRFKPISRLSNFSFLQVYIRSIRMRWIILKF